MGYGARSAPPNCGGTVGQDCLTCVFVRSAECKMQSNASVTGGVAQPPLFEPEPQSRRPAVQNGLPALSQVRRASAPERAPVPHTRKRRNSRMRSRKRVTVKKMARNRLFEKRTQCVAAVSRIWKNEPNSSQPSGESEKNEPNLSQHWMLKCVVRLRSNCLFVSFPLPDRSRGQASRK
jgi:hypothetical protein